MTERFARWVTSHPITILITFFTATAIIAGGALQLNFSNDYRLFFSSDNPQLQAFESLQNTYTKNDNALIVIAPHNKNVFTQETLSLIEELTKTAWQTPYSTRVNSITNFQQTYTDGDDLIVENLISDPNRLNNDGLLQKRNIALSEPLLVNNLISPKGDVTAINIGVYLPEENASGATPQVMEFIRAAVDAKRIQYPDHDFYITGVVAMNNGLQEFSEADLRTLIPVTFAVALLGLVLLLRSKSGTAATVMVIMLSVAAAMGLAGWSGIILTPTSIAAPTIIATLAIADCIHLLTNYSQALKNNNKQTAMIESLKLNLKPVILTSVTTAIGLLTMNFSDAPPLHDLGNISAIGVIAALIFSTTALPALMMIMPARAANTPQHGDKWMVALSGFVIRQHRPLIWLVVGSALLLAAFIPNNQLNDEFHKFFDEDTPVRQAADFTNENLTGIYEIHYSLSAGEHGGISDPEFLATMEKFIDWYREQPKVIHVYSILDIIKRLNKNMHDNDPAWYRIPEERELSAQYLLLYEMSLPLGLDLNDRINLDKSATRVTITLNSLSTTELLDLEQRAQQWLHDNAPSSMWTEGSSPATMFAHIGQRNIQSMLGGTVVALFLTSIIMIFALRSVRMGLISLLPNLLPIIMAYGVWGLTVGKIGFAMSVVASMSLGIIVDDTIHFLSKYLHARREMRLSTEDAIHHAFATVGKAIWITSLVLVAGFLVLSLSDFEFNSGTGALMAITIICALIADLLFLPPLLMKLDRDKDNSRQKKSAS